MDNADWIQEMLDRKAAKKEEARLQQIQLAKTLAASQSMFRRLMERMNRDASAYQKLSKDSSVSFSQTTPNSFTVARRIFPVFQLDFALEQGHPVVKYTLMTRESQAAERDVQNWEFNIVPTDTDSYAYDSGGSTETDEGDVSKTLLLPLFGKAVNSSAVAGCALDPGCWLAMSL